VRQQPAGSTASEGPCCGPLRPCRPQELFSKYDRSGKGGLSWDDIQAMIQGVRGGGAWRGVGWLGAPHVRACASPLPLCRP
jgi:hypothetical protein